MCGTSEFIISSAPGNVSSYSALTTHAAVYSRPAHGVVVSSRRRVGWNLPTRSASPHYAEACHFLLLLILHLLANVTTQRACLLLWRKRFRTDDVIDDRPYLLLTGDES